MTDHGSADDDALDADAADAAPETVANAAIDLVLVAAVAENGVIGREGEMPWYYPADLQHFKDLTTGHPVVMGRTTYEGIVARIGGPLPGRTNVVISSRDLDLPEDAVLADSIRAAVEAAARAAKDHGVETAYVIGGASVYEQFLPSADGLVITEIPESPDGDTHFPAWATDDWVEAKRESEGELAFVTYERRA